MARIKSDRVALAIGVGGLLAGALDFLAAMFIYSGSWAQIGKAIAAGLVGRAAFEGGIDMAVLGVALHLLISLAAAAIYVLVSLRMCGLRRRPLIGGAAFGLSVFVVMNFIVVPLSAAGGGSFDFAQKLPDIAAHVLLFGPAISLSARAILGAWEARRPRVLPGM